MRKVIGILAIAALAACSPQTDESDTSNTGAEAPSAILQAAVADTTRPEQDRVRDATRHPAEILTFAGIQPGATTLDIGSGGGYYTRILSSAVGDEGMVYAHNFQWVVDRFPNADTSLTAIAGERANVEYYVAPVDRLASGTSTPVDAAFMVLGYHDTVWQQDDIQALSREDRITMNRAVFDVLRPGGALIVIDHRAEDGSGDRDVDAYHRIDEAMVRDEIEAAGFVLESTSDLLANPSDPRNVSDFDPSIRGSTDRFVHLYRRPG